MRSCTGIGTPRPCQTQCGMSAFGGAMAPRVDLADRIQPNAHERQQRRCVVTTTPLYVHSGVSSFKCYDTHTRAQEKTPPQPSPAAASTASIQYCFLSEITQLQHATSSISNALAVGAIVDDPLVSMAALIRRQMLLSSLERLRFSFLVRLEVCFSVRPRGPVFPPRPNCPMP